MNPRASNLRLDNSPAQGAILLAAGGTGGHMFPASALAQSLKQHGYAPYLATYQRGLAYVEAMEAMPVSRVPAATVYGSGPMRLPKRVLTLVWALVRSFMIIRRVKPQAIIGFGGYPSIPALGAAVLMKLPTIIHEQNGVLGRVNTLLAPRVSVVAAGTWPVAVPEGVEPVHVGNPVRASIAERAGAGYIPPGDYPLRIVVIGGSQGARILSDVVPAAIGQLPAALRGQIKVEQQARAEDIARVTQAYADIDVRAEVAPFFDDIPKRFTEAQLVISRSGASTVADISAIGRPSILVPFAAATGDHQTANARGLVDANAAIMMPESKFTPAALAEQIATVLSSPEGAQKMAIAARGQGRMDAAQALGALVQELAHTGAR